jgi:hypothetical protein
MPYTRKGNCVYKETGKKMGCSKDASSAEKYMSALYAAEKGQLKEGYSEDTINPNEPQLAMTITLPNPTQLMASFISTLFSSRTQSHIFHLQVTGPGSFAAHSALNTYYDEIIGLADGLVESFQGRYGIVTGYKGEGQWIENTSDIVKYFEALCMYVEKNRVSLVQDSYIQNQVDEVVALIESTKYKLVNLH